MKNSSLRLLTIISVLLVLLSLSGFNEARLEPVLFINNRVYALQNQFSAKYLSSGSDGNYVLTTDRGEHTDDQLWMVKAINKDGFQLVPYNGAEIQNILWKPKYVGFGNYRLQNLETGNCLDVSPAHTETICDKENMFQEWFPTMKNLTLLKLARENRKPKF